MNQYNQNHGNGSGPEDLHDLAPLYAVDALEPAERADFEQHLPGCPRCQAELADYAEVTAHLAAGAAQTPPPELRSSVLAAVHGTRPLPRTPAAAADTADIGTPGTQTDNADIGTPGTQTGPAVVDTTTGRLGTQTGPAVVVSLEERRRRRGRRLLAAAAAAVLLPGIALAGWNLGVQSEQRKQEQLAAQEQGRENRLLAAPDVATHRVDVSGQPATLVVSRNEGAALFVADALPDPGEGREYQLWLLEGDVPVPDTHFSGGDVNVWLSGDVAEAGAVALTVEPAGGSSTPTFPLVAVAEI